MIISKNLKNRRCRYDVSIPIDSANILEIFAELRGLKKSDMFDLIIKEFAFNHKRELKSYYNISKDGNIEYDC
jgi:hypothetical protein